MRAMKSKGIRHLWVMAVCVFITLGCLLSCDPMVIYDVYFENPTSKNCVVYAMKDSISNVDTIVVQRGERALFFHDWTDGYATTHLGKSIIRVDTPIDYPVGIRIQFENGISIIYYPDSVNSQTQSPYDENSYSYRDINRHKLDITYKLAEIE